MGAMKTVLWFQHKLPSLCRRSIIRSLDRECVGSPHYQLHPWSDGDKPCFFIDDEVSLIPNQDFIGDLPICPFIRVECSELELKITISILWDLTFHYCVIFPPTKAACFRRQKQNQ